MKGKAGFTFDPKQSQYTVRIKNNNLWWLLLLLLLPFILQLKLNKHIPYQVIDSKAKVGVAYPIVKLNYNDKNFFTINPFGFFHKQDLIFTDTANVEGKGVFNVKYTLFSKLFYPKQEVRFDVMSMTECFASDTFNRVFFKLKSLKDNIFEINLEQELVEFVVIDSFDNQVLPDAKVVLTSYNGTYEIKNTDTSDARGVVGFYISSCADSFKVEAGKYGYKSFSRSGFRSEFTSPDNRILPLTPIMKPLEFFVKDKYTKKPIPNATATVNFENSTIQITTNTDGIGKAVFDSIAVVKSFNINVSHPAYYDTTTAQYTVEDFMNMTEEQRTIYLRPKPGSVMFRNIDSLTKEPLPGVNNEVFVNGTKVGDFVSNTDGEFTVPNLKPTDEISINSTAPNYFPNNTDIRNKKVGNLRTLDDRTVQMEPILNPRNVKPPRPNCRAHFSGTLLSDVYIDNHISVIYKPDKYGEYVGEGEYPSNKVAFPNAVAHTFDAIAVDANTRVILYSKPNFQGRVVLDITGPALINNVQWKNDTRINSVMTKTLRNGLEALFPKSCRQWSKENMHSWSNGSLKVICVGN